jgi:oligopeptide transport system permease protein
MIRLIVSRLVQLPVILGVIFGVTFVLAWVAPGSPLERPDGRRPPVAVQEAMERQYNLHSPWTFAGSYLKDVFLHADFGPSLQYPEIRVSQIIAEALPVSAAIGVGALLVGLVVGVGAGVVGALKPGSVLDAGSLGIALLGVSLPAFVTGSVLLVIFVGMLGWLDVGGWEWPGWDFWTINWWGDAWRFSRMFLLPALTLGAMPAAYIARLIRLGLADIMSSDFIRTARAKGLSHRQALFKHALKMAFLPVLSFLGPAAAGVMTGSFVVEKVFDIPGLGEYFVNAVLNKDQFLILGIVLVYSVMLIAFNLMVDVAYAWVDPRIEL